MANHLELRLDDYHIQIITKEKAVLLSYMFKKWWHYVNIPIPDMPHKRGFFLGPFNSKEEAFEAPERV
jgi:hypothetical protein